jgi:hypothetical protein
VSHGGASETVRCTTLTSERQEQMISRVAEWIEAKGLRSPAILFLEAHKPLAPIGSQALFFFQPLLGLVGPLLGWFGGDRIVGDYALLLEDSDNIDRVLAHLEHCPVERG